MSRGFVAKVHQERYIRVKMSPKKINPIIPLVVGIVCIGAALVGGLVAFMQTGETGAKPTNTAKASVSKTSKVKKRVVAAKESEPPTVVEKKQPTPAELRKQTTRILIARIKDTPTELNEEWLDQYMRYIRTEKDLDVFFSEYLSSGKKRTDNYNRTQLASKKLLIHDPRYFVSQASEILFEKDNNEKTLLKGVKSNLAQALYMEQQEVDGLKNMDEAFMGNFFKKLLRMYEMLEEIEQRDGGNLDRWLEDHVRILEASVMDRYLRIKRRLEIARSKKDGTAGQSIAGDLFRTDRLEKSINENLLHLGKVYHQAAVREVVDHRLRQSYADQAFHLLEMICQRVEMSGDAINVLREINDIQRDYLHRLARTSWKRAQLAVAAGEAIQANENFFVATQRYLKTMSLSVEGKREQIAVEYVILKKEIAKWKSGSQTEEAAVGAEL